MERFSFSWKTHEYEHRPKEPIWFWVSILVAVALIAFAIWQRNLLFALFIIVAEILLIVWADREPDEIEVKVDSTGIRIGKHKFYPRSHIEAFSIVEHEHDPHWHDLIILMDRRYLPTVRTHIPERYVRDVRAHLRELYPEYDHQESFIEVLERYFWF